MARRRDPRIFITLAVDMPDHPKFAALTKGQKWLIVEAIMYSRKYLTDGCIDMSIWRKMDTKRNRDAVEQTGVCYTIPKESRQISDEIASDFFTRTGNLLPTNCVYFPTYFDHQQSRAEVEEYLENKRSAGKKGGEAKAASTSQRPEEEVAPATADGYQTGSETVPEKEKEKDKEIKNPPKPPQGSDAQRTELVVIDGGVGGVDKRSTRKRGTPLPDGWMPPGDAIEWAKREHADVDLRKAHEKFSLWWPAQPGQKALKVDWVRTWKTWIATADDRGETLKAGVNRGRGGGRTSAAPAHANGVPLTPAEIKRARSEALKDRPNPEILAAAGIELTDEQRRNLGMLPSGGVVIDADGYEYEDTFAIQA